MTTIESDVIPIEQSQEKIFLFLSDFNNFEKLMPKQQQKRELTIADARKLLLEQETEALLDRTLLGGGRGFLKADLGELHENVPGGPEDHPLACQIMGSDPQEMAAAALKAAEQGRAGDKHYRALAYKDLTREQLTELMAAPARSASSGGHDPTEGLGDETCETLIDEINEEVGFLLFTDE